MSAPEAGADDDGGLTWRGAKLVLTCGDRLLVLRRDDIPTINWPGMWDLPGGAREPGEGPRACALRELHEEFGLHLPPARLEATFAFANPSGGVSVFYTGHITPAEIAAIRFGDEGQCWRMMPVADYIAHPRAVPHFRQRVAQ